MRKWTRISSLLDYIIFILLMAHFLFAVAYKKMPKYSKIPLPNKYPADIPILPPPPPDIYFEQSELDEAISFLNLPTWSRGFIYCNDSGSEVTCSQVVRAYRLIKEWERDIVKEPPEKRKYFVIEHPVKGMGNKMTTDIVGFTLALMSRRQVIVTSNYPSNNGVVFKHIYEFPKSVLTSFDQLPESLRNQRPYKEVPCEEWSCFNVQNFVQSEDQFIGINDLLYGPMVYVNQYTSEFCRENFGLHAAYFISNYFSRFPQEVINRALQYLSTTKKKVWGLHIRYHRAGQYYSHGFNQTMPVLYEEIDRRLAKEDLVLAVATDNKMLKKQIISRYGSRVLMTDALRKPDKDHYSAMVDMALIMGSDEILATFRSTYSYMVVARMGHRAWWIEKESYHCFPSSNSQADGISILYHHRDNCNWRVNDRVQYCGKDHLQTLTYFFDNLVI